MKRFIYLTLFFITLCLNVIAQNFTIDFLFAKDAPHAESLIFEPHYDLENKISHYTFGELLRVQYKYDDRKRLIKKVFQKLDEDEDQISQTTYLYENDRLIEEWIQVPFYQPGEGTVNKTIYKKIYSPSMDHRTDTVKEYTSIPDTPYKTGKKDTVISVRYFNALNLPDSIVATFASWYGDITFKTAFQYNKKGESTRIEMWRKFFNENYELKEYVDVIRGKGKIAYKQVSLPPTEQDLLRSEYYGLLEGGYITEDGTFLVGVDKALDFLKKKYGVDSLSDPTYILTLDDKNRITGRTFLYGKEKLLEASYSYDPQGRTQAEYEHSLKKNFLSSISGFSMDIPKELVQVKYSRKYIKDDMNFAMYLKEPEGKFKKRFEVVKTVTPEGLRTIRDLWKIDSDKQERWETLSDKEELSGESIHSVRYDDSKDKSFEPRTKIVFRKDKEGRFIFREEFDYRSSKQEWIPETRTAWEYDKTGEIIKEERYTYSSYKEEWEGRMTRFERDEKRRLLHEEVKEMKDGEWVNLSKKEFVYDAAGNILSEKMYTGDRWEDKRKWSGKNYQEYTYYEDGEVASEITYDWITKEERWEPEKKVIYDIWEEENWIRSPIKTVYSWKNGDWLPNTRTKNIISDKDHQILYERSDWDEESQDWWVTEKDITYLQEGNSRVRESYQWDNQIEQLKGTHYIKEKKEVIEGKERSVTIYSFWDYENLQWGDSLSVAEWIKEDEHSDEVDIYVKLFREFDVQKDKWINKRKVEETTGYQTGEIIEYIWSEEQAQWLLSRKEEQQKEYSEVKNAVISVFDTKQNDWVKTFFYEYGYEGKVFSVFDPVTGRFQKKYLQDFPSIATWEGDPESGKWIRKYDPDRNRELTDYFKNTMSIETDIDYYDLRVKGYNDYWRKINDSSTD